MNQTGAMGQLLEDRLRYRALYVRTGAMPSTASLTPFSYVILVLVGEGGAGPHDLVRMMRQGAWAYWTSSESQYYAESKRLARLRLVSGTRGSSGCRRRRRPAAPTLAPSTA